MPQQEEPPFAVSVIVPVYNPGPYIDPCIASLLAQTLPADRFEVLFVDDGSTDDTPARLAAYASEHPQLKVISIPNSGWPGKPRNVGIDAARGAYVMFLDQDDQVDPESLQRMYETGSANGADVILGKVTSDFRGVHHALYRETVPRCTVYTAALMNSLTPHKMLRTEFLRREGIRYPEGPRRLEDQLFMTKAYFAAAAASIIGDYVCYRYLRRPDGGNAGSKRIVPAEYYGNLGEVLDVVDRYTEPGEVRDGFYRRFLRTEMLGRLDASNLLTSPADYQSSLLSEVRGLMQARFPVTVDAELGSALRCRAALTRTDGTIEAIAAQADAIRGIRLDARLEKVETSDRAIEVRLTAPLLHDGSPLRLEADPERGWLLPASVTAPVLDPELRRVEDATEMTADVVLKHRELADEWFLPSSVSAQILSGADAGQVVFGGTATIDPQTAAGGRPLRKGIYDLYLRVGVFGVARSGRLDAGPTAESTAPLLVDREHQIHRPYTTANHKFSVNVDAAPKWLDGAIRSATFSAASPGRTVLDLGVVWAEAPSSATLVVIPEHGPKVTWRLRPQDAAGRRWQVPVRDKRHELPLGDHQARVVVKGGEGDAAVKVTLDRPFTMTRAMRRGSLVASLRSRAGRRVRRVFGRDGQRGLRDR